MSIRILAGRARSTRSIAEEETLLRQDLETLSPEEREVVQRILEGITDTGDTDGQALYKQISNAEWKTTPVDIRTFIRDAYYLGNTCDNLYPQLEEDLTALFAGGYREAVFTGAIGYGKTFTASIGVCRILYELSCLRDPHRSLGIAANSNISLVCLSVNELLATKVAYENIATKIEASPYFQENFPFEKTKKELRFPKHIWVAARATTDNSVLGLNVVGGLLDECVCPGTMLLLADGTEVAVEDAVGRQDLVVETFDFEAGEVVAALADVQRKLDRSCYVVGLDNGARLSASEDHPVAVRRGERFEFVALGDLVVGDEVLVYGEVDAREESGPCGEDARSVGVRGVCGETTESGGQGAESGGREESTRRRESLCSAPDARRLESHVWEEALRRSARTNQRIQAGQESDARDESGDVGAPQGRAGAHAGVQGSVVRPEPGAHGKILPFRRDEEPDLKIQCLETTPGRLQVLGASANHQGGIYRIPKFVRVTSYRDAGAGFICDEVRVREHCGLLLVEWPETPNRARFPGVRGPRLCGGSETERFYLQPERARQNERRSVLLQGARVGLRGMGRATAVACVVSKTDLGLQPTYDVSVPGYECFVANGVCVHNTNFMRTQKKNDPRFNMEDQAHNLYNAMMRRMKSRFERKGRLPGILFVVSSKQTHDDFTAKRIAASREDPLVFVRDYALWDVKPDEYFSGDWFYIVVGNEQSPSRILRADEDPDEVQKHLAEGCIMVPVPEDFRHDFEKDLEGSIRDLAGIATVAVSPFIQRREKIIEAIDKTREHPFSTLAYDPSTSATFLWHKMVQPSTEAVADMSLDDVAMERPIINPRAPRHIHIDPSLRGDATGFAMAHIGGWRDVVRRDRDGTRYTERAPVFVADLLLRIVPPLGDELMLGDIRKLIYQLSRRGYMITRVTMDSWQSAEGIQKLNQKGYSAEVLSVDKSMAPYDALKSAIYENRISYYEYAPLIQELRELEHDRIKKKIDHPARGSKDVSDALAGCVWTLIEHATSMPLPMLKSVPAYGGDVWLQEQHQLALAQNHGAGSMASEFGSFGLLPPFLTGGGFNDSD